MLRRSYHLNDRMPKSPKARMATLIMMVGLTTGCQDTTFSGNGKKEAAEPPARQEMTMPSSTTPTSPSVSTIDQQMIRPTNCNQDGGTVAEILTTNLQNGAFAQTVDIALSLHDCDGQAKSLIGKTLLFDTECALPDWLEDPLPYQVKEPATGETLLTGELLVATGDLWGKSRPEFRYFHTQAVDFGKPVSRVILSVDFGGRSLDCANVGGSSTDHEEAPFMFQIGDAAPTKQTIRAQH